MIRLATIAYAIGSAAGVQTDRRLSTDTNSSRATADAMRPRGKPFLERQQSLHVWGSARYPDDEPTLEWEDLSEHGPLGSVCTNIGGGGVCGDGLVCRQGLCRHCQKDSECPSLSECSNHHFGAGRCTVIEQLAWQRAFSNKYEGICSIMIFLASALAAAAGTGGGGMFVPLLVSLSGLKTDKAVPCSQFMIFLGSLVNLSVFASQRHPAARKQPLIDYDCLVLLEPMLCLGVMLGVIANQVTPQWLLLFLLCLTMVIALWRTVSKGIKQYQAESLRIGSTVSRTLSPLQSPLFTPRMPSELLEEYFSLR